MKIMVVDDDEIMRDLLKVMLAGKGYDKVTAVASGDEALHQIVETETPFDCFLLDLQMPDMDGVELCGHLRNVLLYRKTPILMITAAGQKANMERAYAAGATDYVTKPFDVVELLARVGVVEQLIAEIEYADYFRRTLEAKASLSVREKHVAFKYSTIIEEVDRFISMLAMQNYLNRVPHQQSGRMAAYALQIPEMWPIYQGMSAREYHQFLTDISAVLLRSIPSAFKFASYAGNGMFLFVHDIEAIPDIHEIEEHVDFALNKSKLVIDSSGANVALRACFGQVFPHKIFAAKGSYQFIFNALESAQQSARDTRAKPIGSKLQISSVA